MNILYVSQYFPPEMGAPAARVSELARHWARAGHAVTVLTGFPNHPTGVVHPEYRRRFRRLVCREQCDGVDVVRTWLLPVPNRRAIERVLNYLSFTVSACLTGMFLKKPDAIIATSPQLFVGLAGWWLGLIKRAPFILEVRDLWPESITAAGMGSEKDISIKLLKALAAFLYRRASHIVVVTPAFKRELVANWGLAGEKISVVENGVETDLFTPAQNRGAVKERLHLEGKFVVSYVGTLGMAHGLQTIVEAAPRLAAELPRAHFLLVGEGAEREQIVRLAAQRGLGNLTVLPQLPREQIPAVICASDACLVLLKKAPVFKTVIPTKMLEFMACARPVILGVEGQAREIVDEAQAGLFIEPENPGALLQAIKTLFADRELGARLGRNGRKYITAKLSRESTAATYSDLLQALTSPAGVAAVSLREHALERENRELRERLAALHLENAQLRSGRTNNYAGSQTSAPM
ncbi:MAG: glycosyltransferase family 4 protein [Deltaproteobacteria bacterium]|nr:glycosyltransferase family 4 protein [Deltaproteobacteria bacterium]